MFSFNQDVITNPITKSIIAALENKKMFYLFQISAQNLVFSPYNVQTVLSMLFLGTSSGSNSSLQLRRVLHYDNVTYVNAHYAYRDVIKNFKDKYYDHKVLSANGLFVQDGIGISSPYDRALREFYSSKVEHMDFR